MSNKAKILVFDIETLPCTGVFWRPGHQINVSPQNVTEHSQMAMWSAKWLSSKEMMTMNGHDHGHEAMVKGLWDVIDAADMIVAHNGNRFDRTWCNTEFLYAGLPPPAYPKWIDTLSVSRQTFNFESHRLDQIARRLGVGKKIKTDFELWTDWMKGEPKAIKAMTKYCNMDVKVLQAVYYKLRPWMKNHPNVAVYGDGKRPGCNMCGSTKVNKVGLSYTNSGIYQRYRCNDCGAPLKGRTTMLDTGHKANALVGDK
jgi:DNA polymerase elongation subunit (family B)